MKAIVAMLLFVSPAQAKEFHLVYIAEGAKLQYKIDTKNVDEAIMQGADFCFDFFTRTYPTADKVGIIDSCANPQINTKL